MDDYDLEHLTPQEAYREGRRSALRAVERQLNEHDVEMRRRRWPNMLRGSRMFREVFIKRFGEEMKW